MTGPDDFSLDANQPSIKVHLSNLLPLLMFKKQNYIHVDTSIIVILFKSTKRSKTHDKMNSPSSGQPCSKNGFNLPFRNHINKNITQIIFLFAYENNHEKRRTNCLKYNSQFSS